MVPSPSSPSPLRPQHFTVRAGSTAHECPLPAASIAGLGIDPAAPAERVPDDSPTAQATGDPGERLTTSPTRTDRHRPNAAPRSPWQIRTVAGLKPA